MLTCGFILRIVTAVFANSDLDNYLRSRDIKDIHLTGVDTDICILHTAVDAYNLNYDITVHADGVASLSKKVTVGHFGTSRTCSATLMYGY